MLSLLLNRKSRTTFDTSDTRRAYGPIVIDYAIHATKEHRVNLVHYWAMKCKRSMLKSRNLVVIWKCRASVRLPAIYLRVIQTELISIFSMFFKPEQGLQLHRTLSVFTPTCNR